MAKSKLNFMRTTTDKLTVKSGVLSEDCLTITYTDGSSTTVYTTVDETNNSRTVVQVATAVKNSIEYLNYTDVQKKFVEMYLE